MRTIRLTLIALAVIAAAGAGLAIAQDVAEEQERSRFTRFVERQISTPNRQIRLGRIEGALSSDVRISEITIADRDGVWLVIENARLVWSRLALLRRRLSVDSLEADAIRVLRTPVPAAEDGAADNDRASGDDAPFTLPSLPVSVRIDRLAVPRVEIAEGVIGPAARLSVDGAVRLAGGELDTTLAIDRLDRAGSLSLDVAFADDTRRLSVDVTVSEPADGVIANAIGIEGRPALTLSARGDGPLSDFEASLSLVANDETLLSGTTRITGADGGLRFQTDVDGDVSPLVPELYDPLVTGGSRLVLDILRRADGGTEIDAGRFESGVARLDVTGALAPDGVPTRLSVNGRLLRDDGDRIALPGGGGAATVEGATLDLSLDASGAIAADVALKALDSPLLIAPLFEITARGTAQNLAEPGARRVEFSASGRGEGITSSAPALADALGDAPSFAVEGAWASGDPLRLDTAELTSAGLEAAFEGQIAGGLAGDFRLRARDLGALSAVAGRRLAGAVRLSATGSLGFDGMFDLSVDGETRDLAFGVTALDSLLSGETTIAGAARRGDGTLSLSDLRVENRAFQVAADGVVSDTRADLTATATLENLAAVTRKAEGPVAVEFTVSGAAARPSVLLAVTSERLVLSGRTLADLDARFDGSLDRDAAIPVDLDGRITVDGTYDNAPLSIAARLDSAETGRSLSAIEARVADATASGGLTARADGLYEGRLSVDVPALERVAPLALADATGSLIGTIDLAASEGQQSVRLDGNARNVAAGAVSLGAATIALAVDDAFGVPALDGRADLRALAVGSFGVRSASLDAAPDGNATALTLAADFGRGTLDAQGRLARVDGGVRTSIGRLVLAGEGLSARLVTPTAITIADGITVDATQLSIGEGRVSLGGTLGETLDLTAALEAVPLAIANLVKPDLDAAGTLSGSLALSGAPDAPEAEASLSAEGLTAAPLASRGIAPLSVSARGLKRGETITVERFAARVGEGTVRAFGTLGERLDLELVVDALPLALANAIEPALGLSGSVSGRASLSGTRTDPAADFSATVTRATARRLPTGLGPLSAEVQGRYADGAVSLSEALVRVADGRIDATGTVGKRIAITADVTRLPLALANAVRPDLSLSGAVSGTVEASGPVARPRVAFNLAAPQVSARPLDTVRLPTARISAAGVYDRGTVDFSEAVVRIGQGTLSAEGRVGRAIDLSAELRSLPLALGRAFRPDLEPEGTLSGSLSAQGSLVDPVARFDLKGRSVAVAPLRSAGVGGVEVEARGRASKEGLRLGTLSVTGQGLSANVSGNVPFSGPGLSLNGSVEAPLALARPFVAERGATISGNAAARFTVGGSLSDPDVSGSLSASSVEFRDPQTNIALLDGRASARLAGDRVVIEEVSAALGDGRVAVSGTVGIAQPFPADLTVSARNAGYADGRLVSIGFNADLAVTGPLAGTPRLSGTVDVDRAELLVPSRFSGPATMISVIHENTPPAVLETLRRARLGPFAEPPSEGGSGASGVTLDVSVNAPRRIFVRGRGIDAEFGGRVRLTGPVTDVSPAGRFELIRGRLRILGQRIVFTEGTITLLGDLNPQIRMVAETTTKTVTVRVTVTGSAQDPDIAFTSEPELPQDEVLAQLLFGRSLDELSAFQLARLAAAAAELAGGGGGPGFLEQVRVSSGLDNLEVVETDDGGTAAEAGRYISDRIYLSVRAGETSSGVSVNLDITRGLTARVETMTDESTFGVFYQREY